MGGRRFPAEDLPADGVEIGGDGDCEHAYYERIGSDGGTNIYFRCLECSKVVLKYGQAAGGGPGGRDGTAFPSEGRSDSGTKTDHDPLVKGLSFDSEDSRGSGGPRGEKSEDWGRGDSGVLNRLKSVLREILGSDKK